jgi:hypothetical protein
VRLVVAPGVAPGALELALPLGEQVRGAAAHDPAVAVLGRPPEGGVDRAADDQLRPIVGDIRPDALVLGRARGRGGLGPHLADPRQHALEVLATARPKSTPETR